MRTSRAAALAALALAAGTVLPAAPAAFATPNTPAADQVGPASVWYSASNWRILDTRVGNGAPSGKVGPDGVVRLDIAKLLQVPADRLPSSVVMNVTAVDSTEDSYITAYPGGAARPVVSNLNVDTAHKVTSNRVTVQVGPDGIVNLYNHIGRVHLVADLQGWYVPRSAAPVTTPGFTFELGEPQRLLDTRTDLGGHPGKLLGGAGNVFDLDISSVGSISGLQVVQATVTEPTEDAHLTMYPAGQQPWSISDVNFSAGQTATNLSYAYTGREGKLALYTNSGAAHVVVDYLGKFEGNVSGTPAGQHGLFVPATPTRVLDTREGLGAPQHQAGPGSTTRVKVTGLGGVPDNVAAVVLNLTGTNADQAGHVTAHKAGTPVPGTSNLNYTAGQDIASMTIVPVSADGFIELYNPHGSLDLVADVQGYYTS
ncbi:hypothetical protein [Streptomyces sp. CBMA156]|uniref:hypothetical protein n=1 Tax=Streptomyces sp. CBMA156 TaxID=1930280 RepID=UPI001661BFF1|nr:hypothetical protein [Streptomyces sp. CBMA156]MBD0675962.1 hypothetical protein [Streptomyces sp. CBMA156]